MVVRFLLFWKLHFNACLVTQQLTFGDYKFPLTTKLIQEISCKSTYMTNLLVSGSDLQKVNSVEREECGSSKFTSILA